MELTCPKCHASMRNYERNGVHVDQCTECRGIFLDRGELERLVDAEGSFYEHREPHWVPWGGHQQQRQHHKPHKRHKRESFLGELFDLG